MKKILFMRNHSGMPHVHYVVDPLDVTEIDKCMHMCGIDGTVTHALGILLAQGSYSTGAYWMCLSDRDVIPDFSYDNKSGVFGSDDEDDWHRIYGEEPTENTRALADKTIRVGDVVRKETLEAVRALPIGSILRCGATGRYEKKTEEEMLASGHELPQQWKRLHRIVGWTDPYIGDVIERIGPGGEEGRAKQND